MKRLLLTALMSFALLVVGATAVQAQSCSPVTISTQPTSHDDGTGPNFFMTFEPRGGQYPMSGGTFRGFGSSLQVGPAEAKGYVNVPIGFGGCNVSSFNYQVVLWYVITDNATGQVLYTSQTYELSYSCTISPGNPDCGPFDVLTGYDNFRIGAYGHVYRVTAYCYAVVDIDGGLNSPTYSAYMNFYNT